METTSQNRRQLAIGLGVSLICLIIIFLLVSPAEIAAAFREADWRYLSLTVAGIVLFMFIRAIRWRFMLHNQISYGKVLHIQDIGYMLNMLLPFRLGDVGRAILIGNVPPVTLPQGLSTMVVERILDMMFIVVLLPFTLASVSTLPGWMRSGALGTGVVALVGIVVLIIAANQRPFFLRLARNILNRIRRLDTEAWVKRADDVLLGLDSLTRLKDGLILTALSIVIWLPIIFAYYEGMKAVGIEVTLLEAGFVVCAAALSVALPSSPGQIGVFHLGVTAALAILGQPEAESLSFAIAYHAINLLTLTLLGLIGLAATGSTFHSVIQSTQAFMKRPSPTDSTLT